MKKLFFVALLAVVAVGGAYTVKADTYYGTGGSPVFNCVEEAQLECSTISGDIYTSATVQTPATRVDKTQLVTQYNP